jgi:hypothetical protein
MNNTIEIKIMKWDYLRILYYQFLSKYINISSNSHTPILFEDYNTDDYYYMINNNKNMIYSLDEMYEIMKQESPIDPFTRLPINDWCFVKVLITK